MKFISHYRRQFVRRRPGHLAVSADTGLSLLDAATLRSVRSVSAPPGTPGCPVYRPDGQVLAVGGAPGYLSSRSLGGAVCLLDAANRDP